MKKGFTIGGIVLVSILALMITLPFVFQGKIKKMIVEEGNKQLNAKFDFEDLSISLFKNFPKASVTLKNFYLCGINEFQNDTLVKSKEITAAFNVMSLFGDKGYDISKIALEQTDVKAIILKDGKVNWDVMKPDTVASTATAEASSPFKVMLQKFTVTQLNVIYDDRQADMYAKVENLNATISGDLGSDQTTLQIKTAADAVNFNMTGINYLKNASVEADLNIDADLKNNKYTFKENTFKLNAIEASLDGYVALLDTTSMEMDLTLKTPMIGFKELISLIPAIYAKDFEKIKTAGTASLNGHVKGKMEGEKLPAFKLEIKVVDAMFKYPDLPTSVDKINVSAIITNPGGVADLTEININPFSFSVASNPFSVNALIKTPISDAVFDMSAKGVFNLGLVKNFYPLEDMSLTGILNANFHLAGRMSYVEKEQYDKFVADGTLQVSNMKVDMKEMPAITIQKSLFTFTPQSLNLSETTILVGKSDFTTDCKLENYIGYALKGTTLKGALNVNSNHLNVTELMGSTTTTESTTTTATAPMSVIEVPKNINFNMNSNFKELIYDKLTLGDVKGNIVINEGTIDMKNLSTNMLGGSVVINGAYSTAKSVTKPEFNGNFNLSNVSFAQTFKTFEMVQKMAPIFEGLNGNFSGSMALKGVMDQTISPDLTTLTGGGTLKTRELNLSGIKSLDMLADAINMKSLKNINVKDVTINYTIIDGRLVTAPFDLKLPETTINIGGSTGFDQTINYLGKAKLPASTGVLGSLSTVDFKIGGTFTAPKVSLDSKGMVNQAVESIKEKGLDELGKKLGIDLANAEKQKEALLATAQAQADALIAEAQKQVDDLVNKAGSNPLAKMGAQSAGKTIMNEAKKTAANLVKQATAQGDALIEKVNNEEKK